MLIGITGRGGSGKSTVAKLIKKNNPSFGYIDVDLLVEKYVLKSKRLLDEVNLKFNDKKYEIQDIVNAYFNKDSKSKEIHQLFLNEVERVLCEKISLLNTENIIVDWFLLHKMKTFKDMEIKILTILEKKERVKRIIDREKTKDISIFLKVDNCYNENYNCNFDFIIDTSSNDYINSISKIKRWKK